MNKRNKVKHLNRDKGHRDALIKNMVTSLFQYERIESTQAKLRVVRSHAEKLISRAKKNLVEEKPEIQLHNKRMVMRSIKNRDVVAKLFSDIAPRFSERNGGYTRIVKLVNRPSDNSEMGILELVVRKEQTENNSAATAAADVKADKKSKAKKSTKEVKEKETKTSKKTKGKAKEVAAE